MTAEHRLSQWPILFDIAVEILDRFREAQGFAPPWSFGGGTALMLQIDHRESHDIDLFLNDPQILPFLNPETQGYQVTRLPDSYAGDGAGSLKLVFEDAGEIDFICGASILESPTGQREVRGRTVALETPAEIVAKKVWYRGGSFLPRDMFDMAAVVDHFGIGYVLAALRGCGADKCATALATVEKASPEFVRLAIDKLMYRDKNVRLVAGAQDICRRVLEQALAGE